MVKFHTSRPFVCLQKTDIVDRRPLFFSNAESTVVDGFWWGLSPGFLRFGMISLVLALGIVFFFPLLHFSDEIKLRDDSEETH